MLEQQRAVAAYALGHVSDENHLAVAVQVEFKSNS